VDIEVEEIEDPEATIKKRRKPKKVINNDSDKEDNEMDI
jgi:hypothetical protein